MEDLFDVQALNGTVECVAFGNGLPVKLKAVFYAKCPDCGRNANVVPPIDSGPLRIECQCGFQKEFPTVPWGHALRIACRQIMGEGS